MSAERELLAVAALLGAAGTLAWCDHARTPPRALAPATAGRFEPLAPDPAGAAAPSTPTRRELPVAAEEQPPAPPREGLVLCGSGPGLRHLGAVFDRLPTPIFLELCSDAEALARVHRRSADAAVLCVPRRDAKGARGLVLRPLGTFAPVLVCSSENYVRDLRLEDLVGIYHGHIASWETLGGAADPISLHGLQPHRTTGWPRPRGVRRRRAGNHRATLDRVRQLPGALGVVSLAALTDDTPCVRVAGVMPDAWSVRDGSYPFGYTVYLVHQPQVGARLDGLVRFLSSPAGSEILARELVP